MTWRDLITPEEQRIVLPWVGGRSLRFNQQRRTLAGKLPDEYGWYQFALRGKTATLIGASEPSPQRLNQSQNGYLVGNRFVPDTVSLTDITQCWPHRFLQVYLLESGLDKFTRIEVGTSEGSNKLFFKSVAFPLGAEYEVLSAFLERVDSTEAIKEVVPSLQAAFDLETRERNRVAQRRIALQRLLEEEETRKLRDARRQELNESLGSSSERRVVAEYDFESAAAAALAIGGATLLDVRDGHGSDMVVRYRLANRRFECVCDAQLRIIDSGVCLTDEESGEKGDSYFTLESLPAVIMQAEREGVLVVYRHV